MSDKRSPSIKVETNITIGPDTPRFQVEARRAAIKAALTSAVAGLATHTSGVASSVVRNEDDGGAPPWGEVIIGPLWEQANPPDGGDGGDRRLAQVAELFWE